MRDQFSFEKRIDKTRQGPYLHSPTSRYPPLPSPHTPPRLCAWVSHFTCHLAVAG